MCVCVCVSELLAATVRWIAIREVWNSEVPLYIIIIVIMYLRA